MKIKVLFLSAFVASILMFGCNDSTTNTDENNNEIKQDSIIDNTKNESTEQKQEIKTTENESVDSKTLSLSTEKIVFSFKTDKGKTMCLAMEKGGKYLVYRFGQAGKVELQYPEELTNTFEKFTYNYYMRGGGAGNAGVDLNYVSFTGDTHKIIIFEEYSAGDPDNPKESTSVGIRIINLKTNKENKIQGLEKSKQGSLVDFRDNGLIKVVEGEI